MNEKKRRRESREANAAKNMPSMSRWLRLRVVSSWAESFARKDRNNKKKLTVYVTWLHIVMRGILNTGKVKNISAQNRFAFVSPAQPSPSSDHKFPPIVCATFHINSIAFTTINWCRSSEDIFRYFFSLSSSRSSRVGLFAAYSVDWKVLRTFLASISHREDLIDHVLLAFCRVWNENKLTDYRSRRFVLLWLKSRRRQQVAGYGVRSETIKKFIRSLNQLLASF